MTMNPEDDYLVASIVAASARSIDDLTQMRDLYTRLQQDQTLCLAALDAADALMDALFGNRTCDITACVKAYRDARAKVGVNLTMARCQ